MSFVIYAKPYKGHRSAVLPRAKALELQKALKHPDALNRAQKDYISHIKSIHLGKTITERILETKPQTQTSWVDTDLNKKEN